MPLDAHKIAKITANLAKIRQGRTQPVIMTFKRTDGTTYTQTVDVIFRAIQDADPSLDPQGHGSDFKTDDVEISVLTSDVPYTQMRACLYIDLPNTAPGVVMATRYIITKIDAKGMLPGANRMVCALYRQR